MARDLGIPAEDLEEEYRESTDNVVLGLTKTPIRPVRRILMGTVVSRINDYCYCG